MESKWHKRYLISIAFLAFIIVILLAYFHSEIGDKFDFGGQPNEVNLVD